MKRKVRPIAKSGKCPCGKPLTHHHFKCNDCWEENKKTGKLRANAMKKNKERLSKGERK